MDDMWWNTCDGANAILERYERLTATERTELRAFRDWTRDNITML